jgi:hypothetical protein
MACAQADVIAGARLGVVNKPQSCHSDQQPRLQEYAISAHHSLLDCPAVAFRKAVILRNPLKEISLKQCIKIWHKSC